MLGSRKQVDRHNSYFLLPIYEIGGGVGRNDQLL